MSSGTRTQYGDRVEYNHATRMYTIYRPATDERSAVEYEVKESKVMEMIDPTFVTWKIEDVIEVLLESEVPVDEILRPINRRAAIAHTRSLNGS